MFLKTKFGFIFALLLIFGLFIITQPSRADSIIDGGSIDNISDNFIIFKRGDGTGDITVKAGAQTLFSCGSTCNAAVDSGINLTLSAQSGNGSVFQGWSINQDIVNGVQFTSENLPLVMPAATTIVYAKFASGNSSGNILPPVYEDPRDNAIKPPVIDEEPMIIDTGSSTPRVMFWWGKVNQYWDVVKGTWATDPTGAYGARENKLEYCQKIYPSTIKVIAYQAEQSDDWQEPGNTGSSTTATKMSYRCVQSGENVDGESASSLTEIPEGGSICSYFPNSSLCLPLGDAKSIRNSLGIKLDNFVSQGIDANAIKLGRGERVAVLKSYFSAFKKLPETEENFTDLIKISNGQWPSQTSLEAEKAASAEFQKIYKRQANLINKNDEAAVTVMAYGLRQKASNRNLASEAAALKTFKVIYKRAPASTTDWNILQAITYSGASRDTDTDGDGLSDKKEKELGTNPNNKDSDGDGYPDGVEVNNGYDPLKK